MDRRLARALAVVAASALTLLPVYPASAQNQDGSSTKSPIKHVVVIFQENVSFDHYFGTYPYAKANNDGTKYFGGAKDDTPRVNSLESAGLLTNNPNGVNPFRIDRSVPNTCDQDHAYGDEQFAFHGGLMDRFAGTLPNGRPFSCNDKNLGPNSTLGYYDGNTFEATITNGLGAGGNIAGASTSGAVVGDPDPAGDVGSNPKRTQITMSGQNVGDLLNSAGVTWGSFMANCAVVCTGTTGLTMSDYIPHHAFFQYWQSTLNANHTPQ
jgi:phospholipase C